MKLSTITLLLMLLSFSLLAQRTTRTGLRKIKKESVAVEHFDTIAAPSPLVKISGYEKTLRSVTESVFITNNGSDTIKGLCLTIEYRDTHGRQLHQRKEEVEIEVPPAQTRLAKFQSWDKQKVWYYHLSEKPRTRGQSTPYDVKITCDWILLPPRPVQLLSY